MESDRIDMDAEGGCIASPSAFPPHLVTPNSVPTLLERRKALKEGIDALALLDTEWVEPMFVSPVFERM